MTHELVMGALRVLMEHLTAAGTENNRTVRLLAHSSGPLLQHSLVMRLQSRLTSHLECHGCSAPPPVVHTMPHYLSRRHVDLCRFCLHEHTVSRADLRDRLAAPDADGFVLKRVSVERICQARCTERSQATCGTRFDKRYWKGAVL